MAGQLPPLPQGAEIMPPLPAGAQLGTPTAAPGPSAEPTWSFGKYMKQEVGDPVMAAVSRLKDSFEHQHPGDPLPTVGDVLAVPGAAIGGVVDAAVVSPLASGLGYLNPHKLDNPWETLVGGKPSWRPETHKELESDVSGMMMGIAPEAGGAPAAAAAAPKAADIGVSDSSIVGKAANKVAAKGTAAAKPPAPVSPPGATAPDAEHLKAVEGLKKEGIELTPGQQKGGFWRRQEEAQKSNPLIGQAIRDAENKSIVSMNRAMYNRVLAPIGEKYDGTAVGREGVKKVGDILWAGYEKLKPSLKFSPDDALVDDLAEARGKGWRLPEAQDKQLETLINERILKRLGPDGTMDGATFKQVEGELSHFASTYKSSSDAAQRELGNAVDEIQGAMRDNLERSSAPGVREQLKKLNTSWALLKRLEGAAANRAQSGGVFTVGDLLTSIKRADKSSGKRAFARGDAMLQDFGDMAAKVIPNRLPDSGTPERLEFNKPSGLAHAALSAVTNPIASKVIESNAGRVAPAEMSLPTPNVPNASYLYPALPLANNNPFSPSP